MYGVSASFQRFLGKMHCLASHMLISSECVCMRVCECVCVSMCVCVCVCLREYMHVYVLLADKKKMIRDESAVFSLSCFIS